MSDPYLVYDQSNIQVNVYHVKGPLKGSPKERDEQLHSECYIFGSSESDDGEVVPERIYLSDTSEIILQKIAFNCSDLSGKDIFAWIDRRPEKKNLLYGKPIGIHYNDLEEYINPFRSKGIDERFVNLDGSAKRNSKNSSDHYKIYSSLLKGFNIYYCTIEDAKEHSQSFDERDTNRITNGFLKKYFPYYEDPVSDKLSKKIELINFQKSLQTDYLLDPVDVRPHTLIYENNNGIADNGRVDNVLLLDIFKIFRDFTVNDDVPYLRIQNDNYMDSYVKLYTGIINTQFETNRDKTLTKDIFVKWNRNIYLQDGFTKPRGIDKTNTLSFIIYDSKSTNYVTLVLSCDGHINLYCEKLMRIGKFTNKIMKGFIQKANRLVASLNSNLIIPIEKVIENPVRIDMSFLYDISDYHVNTLKKLFGSLFTEFLMISSSDDIIHLLYKCDNYENPKYLSDFITLCKRKKITDDAIIKLIQQRYGLSKSGARDILDDWLRIYFEKPLKLSPDLQNISVIIEKVLDRIKVSVIHVRAIGQLHECMNTVNFIMGIYKERRQNKKKDFTDEINKLFKITAHKNIVTTNVSQAISFFEPEPEPEPEPDMSADVTKDDDDDDDDANDDDDDDDDDDDEYDDDDDDDDEYERFDSSDSSQMAGSSSLASSGSTDESNYPNSRYFVKRLEQKDPRLISYRSSKTKDGYAYKCQASHDKQPISLTLDELKEIDHKTGFKNEGISYSKPMRIEGKGRPEIYYICPKFWDRKHQIPLDPKEKLHPIEVDESGNKVEWRQFVWSKEMKEENGDRFILERSGRPSNRPDSDSYWNKNALKKDDISQYNVQYIHDDVHPELLPLPCCGKKAQVITSKSVSVIQHSGSKSTWVVGEIKGKMIEKPKPIGEGTMNVFVPNIYGKNKDEYLISVSGKEDRRYHISLIKQNKGTKIRLTTEFPLKENTNGHVSDLLKDIFHINIDAPFLRERAEARWKMTENGFYRKGVIQDSDAFLRCLDMIHCIDGEKRNVARDEEKKADNEREKRRKEDEKSDKKESGSVIDDRARIRVKERESDKLRKVNRDRDMNSERSLASFKIKDHLIRDLDRLSDDDIFLIGNGSFIQFFRNEDLEGKYHGKRYEKELINSVKASFKKYLFSNEPNDEKLLIPLMMKISQDKQNLTFSGHKINILVLCEENETIKIIEPHGKLQIFENEPFALIYKKDGIYEALIYYYNHVSRGYLVCERDDSDINKNDVIYIQGETVEVIKKSNDLLTINYIEKEIASEIENKGLIKYDMRCVSEILQNFIITCRDVVSINKKEIICESDLNVIMIERLNFEFVNGYYDTYHKWVGSTYRKKKGRVKIPVFFKPHPRLIPLEPIGNMIQYKIKHIIDNYIKIDNLIQEMFSDKYLPFLDDKTKVIVNGDNLMIGLALSNGFVVPLKNYTYNNTKYKYDTIINVSLLSLQADQLNSGVIIDPSDRYFSKYNKKQQRMYEKFTSLLNEIIPESDFKNKINTILNHPIKLLIHKRFNLLDLFEGNEKTRSNDIKTTKIFIEYLCIHGPDNLHKTLFQNYGSLNEYKYNNYSDEFIILSMKEIIMEAYDNIFIKKSDYIRNISYYEETNPNIKKLLLKKELIEQPVSYYTKYPNMLKKIFTGHIKVYKNVLSEDKCDINIISNLLLNMRTDLTNTDIKRFLLDEYNENDDSYKKQNSILSEEFHYPNERDFLAEVGKSNYNLTIVDYELLSEKLDIGFIMCTNRYTNNDTKFQTYIIIHKQLLQDLDIQMICLYEDYSGTRTDNKECKPISINDKLIHELPDLLRNKEMNRIFKRIYKSIR